jgi:transcriptional regulator with XRE-family HTH domain
VEFHATSNFNNKSSDLLGGALHIGGMKKIADSTKAAESKGEYWETQKRLFGIRVRAARIAAGMDQTVFGERAGWGSARQSNYELGKRWPDTWDLALLRQLTGVTGDWLQFGDTRGMDSQLLEKIVLTAFDHPWVMDKYDRQDIESALLPESGALALGLRAVLAQR